VKKRKLLHTVWGNVKTDATIMDNWLEFLQKKKNRTIISPVNPISKYFLQRK
jgi:hypothetical protein